MFIIVKYGRNESLLCNPMCAVINLLKSIKRRAGYGLTNVTVDLSDVNGLIKELDMHKNEYANRHLESHSTYILVQKEIVPDSDGNDSSSTPIPPQYNYTPLLDKYTELFPNYRLHVAEVFRPTQRIRGGKSPSPAGRMSSKSKKPHSSRSTGKRR